MRAVRTLLEGLIDYAGLFPPASLDMPTAVTSYAQYRREPESWLLGRFVVPTARLDEFAAAAPLGAGADAWRLSALAGPALADDLGAIEAFNRQHAGAALIDTIEIRAAEPAQIERAMALLPGGLTAYVELPLGTDMEQLIATLARLGGRAKVRTGGTTPELFPTTDELLRFIAACVAAGVPFKATAGLHHPLRAMQRLTYAPDSGSTTMYGFLNVFLAAAFIHAGLPVDQVGALLDERDPAAFQFEDHGVGWRDQRVTSDTLAEARRQVALSFGSCSFREPVDDLKAMHLL